MKKYLIVLIIIIFAGSVGFLVLENSEDTPAATETRKKIYVALGDSVAAGVGLEGPSDSSACDRTNQSYPSQFAANNTIDLLNFACSGASITSGIIGSQTVNGLTLDPQLEQLFAQNKPDIITLTIGANDIGWSEILTNCYTTYCGTTTDTQNVETKLSLLAKNLSLVLDKITQNYPTSSPQFFVTGYYKIFPTNPVPNCAELIGIEPVELNWINEFSAKLDTTIKTTVGSYPGATYLAIDFRSHELCTAEPWIQGFLGTKPYHPTATGQEAISNQLDKIVQ